MTTASPCTVLRINGDDFVDALTAADLSPSALGGVQMRLARTHPTATMTFGQSNPEAPAG